MTKFEEFRILLVEKDMTPTMMTTSKMNMNLIDKDDLNNEANLKDKNNLTIRRKSVVFTASFSISLPIQILDIKNLHFWIVQ